MSLVFDIETCPIPMSIDELRAVAPSIPGVDRGSDEFVRQWRDRAALSPYTGMIRAIAYRRYLANHPDNGLGDLVRAGIFILDPAMRHAERDVVINGVVEISSSGSEAAVLEDFFVAAFNALTSPRARLVGFACNHFDLPFIRLRAVHRDVRMPASVMQNAVDLQHFFSGPDGVVQSLDRARRFVDDSIPKKLGSGKGFSALWQDDRGAAIQYAMRDVQITASIANRLIRVGLLQIA